MKYPLITLSNTSLSFDSKPLFKDISLSIVKGDRICLVGRNGSGKSSLLKIIAGIIKADSGERFVKPGSSISYLQQNYDFSKFSTLFDFIFEQTDETEYYREERLLGGISVDFNVLVENASGGELRRAALLKTLISSCEVMLLDEPTNHLDIDAIEFLENYLKSTGKAYVLISHDRKFLENLGKKMIWIDRGVARTLNQGFSFFEDWRDKALDEEAVNIKKLNSKIKKESIWAVEGISARRKRNQGRLAELRMLKNKKENLTIAPDAPKFNFSVGEKSGKVIIDVVNISKMYSSREIVKNFSFSIRRGDRIALVGPNGVGKTTLINLFLKRVKPDVGKVKLGTALNISVFDQNKGSLPVNKSVWNLLSDDAELGGGGKNDQVLVRGRPRHIVSYLKDFLFSEEQVYGLISDLSGGEKSRLLLAILMARESNLIVLDEPTNDLDLETLDLLKELISLYDGTIVFVSHDRDFIDSIASHTFLMQKDKPIIVHAGGFSDFRNSLGDIEGANSVSRIKMRKKTIVNLENLNEKNKQSLEKRINEVNIKIERLNYEIGKLESGLSKDNLYIENQKKFDLITDELLSRKKILEEAEEEWLKIELQRSV